MSQGQAEINDYKEKIVASGHSRKQYFQCRNP